jgi:hypothetical protein
MKWNVSVGVSLTIDYDDIEAETQEEAEEIAKEQALEDVDFNNAELDGIDVYCAYPNDSLCDGVDHCIICGEVIPEGNHICHACELYSDEKSN